MKKFNHKAIAAALAATMALSIPMSASAAWNQSSNGTWNFTNNSGKVTGWNFINDQWYHFDNNGVMTTGWMKDSMSGKWYFLTESGAMAKGWAKDNGKWYFLDGSGAMKTGWVKTSNKWYHMASNGAMNTGWVTIGDKKYFTSSSGAMQSGVVEVDGEIYYFGEAGDGAMKTGKVEIDGKSYRFDEDGKATGSVKPVAAVAFKTAGSATPAPVKPTPAKPTYSGGGGGSSSGGNDSDDGGDSGDPETKDATISIANVLDFDFAPTYDKVTVVADGPMDLSALKAKEIVILENAPTKGRAATPVLTFGAGAASIEVNFKVEISSIVPLPKLTVTVPNVTIDAPVTNMAVSGTAENITLNKPVASFASSVAVTLGGTGTVTEIKPTANITLTGSVSADKITIAASSAQLTVASTGTGTIAEVDAQGPTKIAADVAKVTAKADIEVAAGKTVNSMEVPATAPAVTISGAGTTGFLDAKAPITVEAKVGSINTEQSVTLSSTAKVDSINVTGNEKVDIKPSEAGVTMPEITADTPTNVTVKDEAGNKNESVTVSKVAKLEAGDFTFTPASAATPTGATLVTSLADDKIEYSSDNGANWTKLKQSTEVPSLATGTYMIRKAASGTKGDAGYTAASVPAIIEHKGFNGFGNNGIYYVKSTAVTGKAQWIQFEGTTYAIDTDGKKVTDTWVSNSGTTEVYVINGLSQGDFGLYAVKSGTNKLTGTKSYMKYKVAGGSEKACVDGETTIDPALTASGNVAVTIPAQTKIGDITVAVAPTGINVYVVAAGSANKSVLMNAIATANTNVATVETSADGKDKAPTTKWVTTEVETAYKSAIAAATTINDKAAATQAEVDKAVSDLNLATATFNAAKKPGTKIEAVKVADGSVAGITAGDKKITGLKANTVYMVEVDATTKYVKADGTLTADIKDAAPISVTEITGLTNDTTYKVVAATAVELKTTDVTGWDTAEEPAQVETGFTSTFANGVNTLEYTGAEDLANFQVNVAGFVDNKMLGALTTSKFTYAIPGRTVESVADSGPFYAYNFIGGGNGDATKDNWTRYGDSNQEQKLRDTWQGETGTGLWISKDTENVGTFVYVGTAATRTYIFHGDDGTLKTLTVKTVMAPTVNKTQLKNAVAAANTAKEAVKTSSTEGADVLEGTRWVVESAMTAYTEAITAAQAVINKTDATPADVTAALTALNTATTTFVAAQKDGTKKSDIAAAKKLIEEATYTAVTVDWDTDTAKTLKAATDKVTTLVSAIDGLTDKATVKSVSFAKAPSVTDAGLAKASHAFEVTITTGADDTLATATATINVEVTFNKAATTEKSLAPTTATATVKKTTATQKTAKFVLTSAHTATTGWNVYDVETGGTALTDVTVAFVADGKELTLSASGDDLAAKTYYVAWKDGDKTESDRLALTVEVYTAPAGSVKLASESVGTAGDKKITGLTAGTYYMVLTGTTTPTTSYVQANGTLGTTIDKSAPLTGTEITGLTNDETYKVVAATAATLETNALTGWDDKDVAVTTDFTATADANGVYQLEYTGTSTMVNYQINVNNIVDTGMLGDVKTSKFTYAIPERTVNGSSIPGPFFAYAFVSGEGDPASDKWKKYGDSAETAVTREQAQADNKTCLWISADAANEGTFVYMSASGPRTYVFHGDDDTFKILKINAVMPDKAPFAEAALKFGTNDFGPDWFKGKDYTYAASGQLGEDAEGHAALLSAVTGCPGVTGNFAKDVTHTYDATTGKLVWAGNYTVPAEMVGNVEVFFKAPEGTATAKFIGSDGSDLHTYTKTELEGAFSAWSIRDGEALYLRAGITLNDTYSAPAFQFFDADGKLISTRTFVVETAHAPAQS